MLGGNDMNVFGAATQGKKRREKDSGRNIPGRSRITFHAQISIANAPKLYRAFWMGSNIAERPPAMLHKPASRNTEFADDMALTQAQRVRDSAGLRSLFSTAAWRNVQESLDLKGNPSMEKEIGTKRSSRLPTSLPLYRGSLVRHGSALPEPLKKIKKDDAAKLIHWKICSSCHPTRCGLPPLSNSEHRSHISPTSAFI